MSDTNNNPALARLQALLAAGTISQDDFNLLAASHRPPAAVARKPAPRARQRAADGAVQVGGDVHAPVTVHHQVVHAAPDSAAERAAAQAEVLRRQYLGRVWGQANAVSLLAGSKQRDGVRLAAVYTALMTDRPAQPKPSRGKSGVARGVLPEHLARARSSALAVLDSDRRLVLLGGPGSGKSTFVNYVAQAMAGEALGPDDNLVVYFAGHGEVDVVAVARALPKHSHRAFVPWSGLHAAEVRLGYEGVAALRIGSEVA